MITMVTALTNKPSTKYGTVKRVELFETNKANDVRISGWVLAVAVVSDCMHKWPISELIFMILHRAVASIGKCSDVCYMKTANKQRQPYEQLGFYCNTSIKVNGKTFWRKILINLNEEKKKRTCTIVSKFRNSFQMHAVDVNANGKFVLISRQVNDACKSVDETGIRW